MGLMPLLLLATGCDLQIASTEGELPHAVVEPSEGVDEPSTPSESPDDGEAFDAVGALSRASLDLRGIRPSLEQLAAIEADPAAYDVMVSAYLEDERFGARVREMFAEIWLTRQDYYYVTASDYGLDDEISFSASVGDEPLRILSEIVTQDLPWSDIVTADWTMANETLGAAWPLDYPEGETGWQQVHYTDGRPSAGILSTNGMWWRYTSTDSNANRGRANAVSRILLCEDYLSRPIEFDRNVNLLDSDALSDALANNPGCAACHSTLDPLASNFYGFYQYLYFSKLELTNYHAERENMWESTTGVEPAYMGEPVYNLHDLGAAIAGDSRIIECATQRVFELLLDREAELSDSDTLTANREAFIQQGLALRAVFREVLESDEYRLGLASDGSPQPKMLSADQLGTAIADLTGFTFTYAGYDVLHNDSYGVRTLAGGVDGVYATKPADAPTATIALVQERVSQAAASYAAEFDHNNPDQARLFTLIDFTETPDADRDQMAAQIQLLHLRLFGDHVDLDGEEVTANLDLWEDLYQVEGSKEAAWADLLSVLLRDPQFLFY